MTGKEPPPVTWDDLWGVWEHVDNDLHQIYRIDLFALPDRPWRWLRTRIRGLLSDPHTRTYRSMSSKGADT